MPVKQVGSQVHPLKKGMCNPIPAESHVAKLVRMLACLLCADSLPHPLLHWTPSGRTQPLLCTERLWAYQSGWNGGLLQGCPFLRGSHIMTPRDCIPAICILQTRTHSPHSYACSRNLGHEPQVPRDFFE